MTQQHHKKFLAELGNILIQFQIEQMNKEKSVPSTSTKKEKGEAKADRPSKPASRRKSKSRQ